jgi:hypothetical protein
MDTDCFPSREPDPVLADAGFRSFDGIFKTRCNAGGRVSPDAGFGPPLVRAGCDNPNPANRHYNSCFPRHLRIMVQVAGVWAKGLKAKPSVRACCGPEISRTKHVTYKETRERSVARYPG